MSIDNVPLLRGGMHRPSTVQFGANTRSQQQELERSAFLGTERRPWMQAKPRPKTHKEREAIMALLATSSVSRDNKAKLSIEENISFGDLASLTAEDLELFGFTARSERTDLIKLFAQMCNQDPSYDDICNTNAAACYNNQIVGNAANHIQYLRSSLAATNYKLKVMPPEDVIVGDKRYASRFALEALSSVQSISDELIKDLRKLEQLASKRSDDQPPGNAKAAKKRNLKIIYYTALALGSACAWWWWWSKRNYSPSLQNVALKI
ncbi:uncharacterized protein LOC6562420 [Drosophila grimshawi]|uniref:GH11469 n=1 Tax=Drosophila grimshawi TaxID=7222 RepID=B4JAP9_DROGR|nr:uncharacterized protein LOC6562420 [Drosophila grimshawi]EDW03857.1 GH11469 [Drosophila grimshawi]